MKTKTIVGFEFDEDLFQDLSNEALSIIVDILTVLKMPERHGIVAVRNDEGYSKEAVTWLEKVSGKYFTTVIPNPYQCILMMDEPVFAEDLISN